MTPGVNERAAGIARVDRRVGLEETNQVLHCGAGLSVHRHASVQTGDDTARHRHAEIERKTDRVDGFGEAQITRPAEHHGLEPRRIDLHDRDVVLRVGSDHVPRHRRVPIREDHANLHGSLDDVVVGHDDAICRHDDAGSFGLHLADLTGGRS